MNGLGSTLRVQIGIARRRHALSSSTHSVTRWKVLRRLGWTHLEDCFIAPDCTLIGTDIHIGNGAYLNYGVLVDALAAPVHIGTKVHLAQRVMLITGSHEIGGPERRAGAGTAAPVRIGDGAWIGAGATILPGVTIGQGAVVGAHALVVRDVPANTVHAGVPAVEIRALPG